MDREQAEHFAAEWVAAWNAHDLERILAHYADDFVMSSPMIVRVTGEASGCLRGKAAVGAYWAQALAAFPDLRFTLREVLVGVGSVALRYDGVRGPAIEVFRFDDEGRVREASAHYQP